MAAERSGFGVAARVVVLGGFVLAVLAFVFLGNRGSNQASAAQLTEDHAAVFKDKDKLLVSINLGNPDGENLRGVLTVQLLGPDKKSLAKMSSPVDQNEAAASYRFELPLTDVPLNKLSLQGQFGDQVFTVPLEKVLLAKAHETSLSASPELYSNSVAAVRCGVHGCKSYTDTIPLAGADVAIELKTAEGQVFPLHQGKTEANGLAVARFKVPDLKPGQYTLVVATKSTLGEEKLEHQVKVKSEPKILLVTDKPLYQPGQLIHIRALSLKPMDLSPAGNADVVFEVEDAKGNKVFKKTQKTSDFGIASVDFQLADEINMGDYQIRALLGDHQASKTVTVKKYVLPKFKVEVKSNKRFYLPKETIEADLQSDYFFGKPVAGSTIQVKASTFDVQFKEFQTWEGKTDENGHAKFEIKLPDYFVGQPLAKGDALVKLEVKVTDTADHSETITKSYNVSEQPIRVSLIPEGGRLVPGLENRVFAAAIYPDGTPAVCDVELWNGQQAKDKPFQSLKTNAAGLAEFKLNLKAEQFRQLGWEQKQIDVLGGRTVQVNGPRQVFDLFVQAKDAKGSQASAKAEVSGSVFGDNLLLRLDKAIYKGGDKVAAEIRTSAGTPTAYLDFVRNGQILLSRWFDVKEGKASTSLDLPASVFGTVEVHAYQMLNTGEIIRDSRVVYVQPPEGLKIDVKADQAEYKPGAKGSIRFQVTDAAGKPTAAALGVIIVDEAVYALQDMQPGLEKVYFTLQEELLKPKVQAVYRPAESIDILVREPALPADKQQIAQVLLTSVQPKLPQRWELDPAIERRQKIEAQVQVLAQHIYARASNNQPFMEYDASAKKWVFVPNLLAEVVKTYGLDPVVLKDPFGQPLDLDKLADLEANFTVDNLARAVTLQRMTNIYWNLINYTNQNRNKYFKDEKWELPEMIVRQLAVERRLQDSWTKDAWGETIRLERVKDKLEHRTGQTQFDHHQLVSAGPDRKFGTEDDVKMVSPNQANLLHYWWLESATRLATAQQEQWGAMPGGRGGRLDHRFMLEKRLRNGAELERGAVFPQAQLGAIPPGAPVDLAEDKAADPTATTNAPAGAAPILRVREYFPETMLWQPSLITDDKGVAILPVEFADSITTWRLSASASSRGGLLGGTNAPLKVFQDFFVDIDLPVSLTQNDEVAFPVAVYNYLKEPQTVTLELQPEKWFELVDGAGLKRSLDLKPNEVTSIKFRIRANKVGHQPLLVKAIGTKMSDAIKRIVEVAPDGKRLDIVATDRLSGNVSHTIDIPETAIPDSQKLFVKLYPGVFSQVLEGTEGMLRMPCGCFEQTSSSAYPNILVADYIKTARVANAQQHLMKAEQYLNAGYQRLLTFERPGGGFDWWGSGPPLVWLSAYGLQEFNDMSRVWPVDRGIIQRT
ncbi:MAG: MG2 domain-containing protein, partial [Gemmataceae bacterium]